MTPADFEFLRRFLKERSGLVLTPEKDYFVQGRLSPIARRLNCHSISGLVRKLRETDADALKVEVTEAMMNNESFFFRDKVPFERFADTILPDLVRRRAERRRLRLWSAAASTGQEPYSMAMVIDAFSPLADWSIDIVASDISSDALEKARAGLYSQFEVQRGLPIHMLMQHFQQEGEQWRISPKLRKRVQFRQINLLHDFSSLGMFDVIFCRNVLIYFDQATKVSVLERIKQVLAPDGYLVLGAAETVVGLTELFSPIPDKRGLYVVKPRLKAVSGAKVA